MEEVEGGGEFGYKKAIQRPGGNDTVLYLYYGDDYTNLQMIRMHRTKQTPSPNTHKSM